MVSKLSRSTRVRLLFAAIGLFGAALAITGLFAALPKPAAGGTCGPSTGSESAIEAIVEPSSIGAGPRPPASQSAARQQWEAFVNDCQSAATGRLIAVIVILAVSLALALLGPVLVLRRKPRQRSLLSHDTAYAPPLGFGGPGYGPTPGFGVGVAPPGVPPYGPSPGTAPYGLQIPSPGGGVATAPAPPWGHDAAWPAPTAPSPAATPPTAPPPTAPPPGWTAFPRPDNAPAAEVAPAPPAPERSPDPLEGGHGSAGGPDGGPDSGPGSDPTS